MTQAREHPINQCLVLLPFPFEVDFFFLVLPGATLSKVKVCMTLIIPQPMVKGYIGTACIDISMTAWPPVDPNVDRRFHYLERVLFF